jgi:hypothetical protein
MVGLIRAIVGDSNVLKANRWTAGEISIGVHAPATMISISLPGVDIESGTVSVVQQAGNKRVVWGMDGVNVLRVFGRRMLYGQLFALGRFWQRGWLRRPYIIKDWMGCPRHYSTELHEILVKTPVVIVIVRVGRRRVYARSDATDLVWWVLLADICRVCFGSPHFRAVLNLGAIRNQCGSRKIVWRSERWRRTVHYST